MIAMLEAVTDDGKRTLEASKNIIPGSGSRKPLHFRLEIRKMKKQDNVVSKPAEH